MMKFLAIFLLGAFSIANAIDGTAVGAAASRQNGSMLWMPTFYEDQISKPSSGASQIPVNLERPIDSNYIIGPGDFFEILLPNGSEGLQVSPEGTIAIQYCGLVEVSGLKLHEAKQKILEKLKNRYDQKFIGVHLVQLRSFVVNVQGAVLNPGQVVMSGQARARNAIYSAGNYKYYANKDSIYIYRRGDTIITAENPILEVGDIVEVPYKGWWQTVDLTYLGKTITLPYTPDFTLKEYAKEAGMNMGSNYTEISIKNPEDGFTRWIGIDNIDSFSPEPLSKIEFHVQAPYVYVGGATATVGRVPYNSSMHPADYVAASGVTIITGKLSRVSVMRNGKRVSVDWAAGEILPGDFIEIPRTVYEQVKDVTLFLTSILSIVATVLIIASY